MFLILQAVFMIKSVEENITKKKGENYYEKVYQEVEYTVQMLFHLIDLESVY